MKSKAPRIILVLVLIGLIAAFFIFDLKQYLSFEFLKAKQGDFLLFSDISYVFFS